MSTFGRLCSRVGIGPDRARHWALRQEDVVVASKLDYLQWLLDGRPGW